MFDHAHIKHLLVSLLPAFYPGAVCQLSTYTEEGRVECGTGVLFAVCIGGLLFVSRNNGGAYFNSR